MYPNQAMHTEYKKLVWKCRRGSKELDLILNHFLENRYEDADPERQRAFRQLLEYSDPDIQDLLNGIAVSDDKVMSGLIGDMYSDD